MKAIRRLAIFIMAIIIMIMPNMSFAENGVCHIGNKSYESLEAAFNEAGDGDTIVLDKNVLVDTQITISNNVALDLNGNTITNAVVNERLFNVAASSFTVDGTITGSAMVIPDSNEASYGFIKISEPSIVTLNGGNYSGNTDNGAFVKIFNDNVIDASGSTVVFNNVTMSSNNAFFNTDTLNTDADTTTLAVTGGTYTTEGKAFGVDTYALSPVTFEGVTVTAGAGPCIEVCGASASFADCNFKVTGTNSNGFGTTAVAVSWGGNAVIDGGTYSSENGYGIYVYNSGGHITIKDGTVSGGKAAVKADKDKQSGVPSSIIVEGGNTIGAWETNDEIEAPLIVYGGTHTADVSDYIADDVKIVDNGDGTYSVGIDCIVTFYDENGKEIADSSITVLSGTIIGKDNAPSLSKEGYTFAGWFEKNSNEPWNLDEDRVSGKMSLYARWTANSTDDGEGTDDGSQSGQSENGDKSVETGDDSNVVLWACILAFSIVGGTGVVIYGRKRKEQ